MKGDVLHKGPGNPINPLNVPKLTSVQSYTYDNKLKSHHRLLLYIGFSPNTQESRDYFKYALYHFDWIRLIFGIDSDELKRILTKYYNQDLDPFHHLNGSDDLIKLYQPIKNAITKAKRVKK